MTTPIGRRPGLSRAILAHRAGQPLAPNSQTQSRTIPQPPAVQASQRSGNFVTEATTVFTPAGRTFELYSADQWWAQVTLTLETAGPVEVSRSQTWAFLTGAGQGLLTNVPLTFTCAKASKLFLQAASINRVKVTIAPVPWLEQITGTLRVVGSSIVDAIAALKRTP